MTANMPTGVKVLKTSSKSVICRGKPGARQLWVVHSVDPDAHLKSGAHSPAKRRNQKFKSATFKAVEEAGTAEFWPISERVTSCGLSLARRRKCLRRFTADFLKTSESSRRRCRDPDIVVTIDRHAAGRRKLVECLLGRESVASGILEQCYSRSIYLLQIIARNGTLAPVVSTHHS
jgi:hypothetical protein